MSSKYGFLKKSCSPLSQVVAPTARLAHTQICCAESVWANCSLKFENNFCPQEAWMSSAQAAVYLGISLGSLRNKVSNGFIPRHKLGRLNRFLKSELDQLLNSDS